MGLIEKKNIVLISTERWGKNFVSKHHYASYLSKTNTVFYLNPVVTSWRFRNLFNSAVEVHQVKENLFQVSYTNPLPKLTAMPFWIQRLAFRRVIHQVKKKIKTSPDIVWTFDPTRFVAIKDWKAPVTIYHAVDLIHHPHHVDAAKFRTKIIQSADLVLCVADTILEDAKQINPKSFKVNHGADLTSFFSAKPVDELPGKNLIKIGYVGNFQYSINYDLLAEMADTFTQADFIFIGPYADNNLGKIKNEVVLPAIEKLQKRSNIFMVGEKDSNELMNYMLRFDINLMIYKDEFLKGHANPHKLMGYFYAGNVTLSNYIDDYRNASKDLIFLVKSQTDLMPAMADILTDLKKWNAPHLQEIRRNFAIENGYDQKIDEIGKLIQQAT